MLQIILHLLQVQLLLIKNTALQKIAEDLKNPDIANFTILGYLEKTQKRVTSANQRLVYTNDENGNLRLAYEYILMEPKSPNYWNIFSRCQQWKYPVEKQSDTIM